MRGEERKASDISDPEGNSVRHVRYRISNVAKLNCTTWQHCLLYLLVRREIFHRLVLAAIKGTFTRFWCTIERYCALRSSRRPRSSFRSL